ERTGEDLTRLEDIIGEISRQMRPLRRQARAAERYHDLRQEVVSLRLHLAGKKLEELDRELTISVSERSMLAETMEVDRGRLRSERTGEDLTRLEDIIGEISRQMRPLRRQARAAERYHDLRQEVVSLRLHLAGKKLEELDRELTISVSERSMLAETMEVDRGRL